MSEIVQVGGTLFTIPDQGDPPGWGANLTPFFVALAAELATSPAFFENVPVVSTPITVGTSQTYLVASNSITATLNLPAPVQNLWFAVKDSGKNAAVNNITIHRYGSEQINGVAADKVLSLSGGWWMFGCDGTNWYMLRDVEALNPLKATNQLVITPSNGSTTMTLNFAAPAASNVITLPDLSTAWNVVGTAGTQTIGGAKTFSSAVAISASSGSTLAVNTSDLVVDSTNHRVGIGIAAPIKVLDVRGATSGLVLIAPSDDVSPTVDIFQITNAALSNMFNISKAGAFTARASSTQTVSSGESKFTIEATAASQSATLQMRANNATPGQNTIYFGNSSNATIGNINYDHNANVWSVQTNSAQRIKVDSAGDFTVNASASPNIYISSTAGGGVILRLLASSTSAAYVQTNSNHPMYFTTNNGINALEITTSQTCNVRGTQTNDSAAASFVGEAVRSSVTAGVSSTGTGQFFDITSISLTAGDWDVSGLAIFTLNGATATVALMAITSTSGNSTTGQIDGDNRCAVTVPTSANDNSGSIPCYRVSIASTTTYYLKSRMDFSVATPKAYGRISARRVR